MFNILPMEANYKEGAIMREQLLETAVAAARAGARLLRERWSAPRTISRKERYDFVTDADLASQRAVLAVIEERHPDHAILAEEERGDPATAARTPGVLWVVDPLDGTTNFIHGFPMAAVSVAAVAGGRPLAGAIIDVVHGEEFKAARGLGAFVDDRPMRVADIEDRSQCLLLTGFPFRDRGRLDPYLELFKELFGQSSGVRRAGSAALDLAYVAAGRAQGFWEMGLKPWDVAAGIVLVEEAGGVVSDFAGGGEALWRGDVVAAAPGVHGWMQQACERYFPLG